MARSSGLKIALVAMAACLAGCSFFGGDEAEEAPALEGLEEVAASEPDLSPPPAPTGDAVRVSRVLSVTFDPAPNGIIVRATGIRPDLEHTSPRLRRAGPTRLTPPGGIIWVNMLLSDPDAGKISLRLPSTRFFNLGAATASGSAPVFEDTSVAEDLRTVEAATFLSQSQLRGATTITVLGQDNSVSIPLPAQ